MPLTRLNYTLINEDNFLGLLAEIKKIFHFLEKQKITFIFQKKDIQRMELLLRTTLRKHSSQ